MQKHRVSLLPYLLSRSAHVGHCVTQLTKTDQQLSAGLHSITFKPKYLSGSCERHFVYAHVRRYCRSRRWPKPWHNIDDSRRKAGLSKQYERKQALVDGGAKQNHRQCGGIRTQPKPSDMQGEQRNIKKKTKKQRTGLRLVERIIILLLLDRLEM